MGDYFNIPERGAHTRTAELDRHVHAAKPEAPRHVVGLHLLRAAPEDARRLVRARDIGKLRTKAPRIDEIRSFNGIDGTDVRTETRAAFDALLLVDDGAPAVGSCADRANRAIRPALTAADAFFSDDHSGGLDFWKLTVFSRQKAGTTEPLYLSSTKAFTSGLWKAL